MVLRTVLDELANRLRPVLAQQRRLSAPLMPGSGEALLAWALRSSVPYPILWICDGSATLESRHRDFAALAPSDAARDHGLLFYPDWESLPGAGREEDAEAAGQRLSVLRRLVQADGAAAAGTAPIVVTCIQALMQRTPAVADLAAHVLSLAVGGTAALDVVVAALVAAGYHHAPEVDAKGALCVKGGLLDVWPVTECWPLRIEFADQTVASIRAFDPADQRSRRRLDAVDIPPRSEWAFLGGPGRATPACVADYIPDGALVVWSDADAIDHHGHALEEAAAEDTAAWALVPLEELRTRLNGLGHGRRLTIGATCGTDEGVLPVDFAPSACVAALAGDRLQPDAVERQRQQVIGDARARSDAGWRVLFLFDSPASLEHYRPRLSDAADPKAVALCTGPLSGGFICEALRTQAVAESDLTGSSKRQATRYAPRGDRAAAVRDAGARLSTLDGLDPGDLVVHIDHGIGRYLGLFEIEVAGQPQEVLTVEYDEGAKLHVPSAHVHLLSRYVGATRAAPRLHRLGGRRWHAEKAAADQAVQDLAAELLETQAQRHTLVGRAFPPDAPWQHDFEAAFPYRETADQERAIAAIKADLESQRPADRLVCGDAGYGKTEVAMRAAFKVVSAGSQVAVLVPTTVLAQQHHETFRERMAGYPFRIEMLSRFCSHANHGRVLAGLADGSVDIVIGTHALIQPGIAFRDLGLVIVDEEQRFGVQHKERLKHIRRLVDVLTLTATPIPRTLYMSLTGARDMSLIQTPPRERVAIETIAARTSPDLIRRAILRELGREGQAFYLHNRVMTIGAVRARLERLVPEARFAVAHGQMAAAELAAVMRRFVDGAADVLICTTIIESGVDIPRANTILIDRADRFGIADLYQLRGRVGRASHKAYAYLLLPAEGALDDEARTRIGAVRKYSSLSAGFNLAMRDLEIRGAGNLLGAQQSGHIAAVGFGLYCQLLRRCVARLKGTAPPRVADAEVRLDFVDLSPRATGSPSSVAIPYDYIDEESQRIAVYGKLALCATPREVDALRAELQDRFGPPPAPVERLLRVTLLKALASERDIRSIEVTAGSVRMQRDGEFIMPERRFPRLAAGTPDRQLDSLLTLMLQIPRTQSSA